MRPSRFAAVALLCLVVMLGVTACQSSGDRDDDRYRGFYGGASGGMANP